MSSDATFGHDGLNLPELLDLSILESSAQVSERFSQIANALLNKYLLCVEHGGIITDFRLLEIEFYFFMEGVHEDPFCHGHVDQTRSAQWYFHRAGKGSAVLVSRPTEAGGFRGGTRKGLDLTFGSPITSSYFPERQPSQTGIRGGILLRSMQTTESGKPAVISGPSLLVDKILFLTNSRNIAGLVNQKLGSVAALQDIQSNSADTNLARIYLKKSAISSNTSIHRSPRIGLDLSHPSVIPQVKDARVSFIGRSYRYFISPEQLKSNGRCNNFVGLLVEAFPEGISKSLSSDGPIPPIVAGRLQEHMKMTSSERYVNDFLDGFSKRSLGEFIGARGKGAGSNPRLFMRLMGVLGRSGLLDG